MEITPLWEYLKRNGYKFIKEEFGAEDDPYGNGMMIYKKEC